MLNPAQQSPCEAAFAPLGAQVLVQAFAEVAEVPRQNFALVQHSLALVHPVPAEPQVGADWQTPLVHASWLQHCVRLRTSGRCFGSSSAPGRCRSDT